ncbi:UNVERIFIED_CONTAM: hypothetical protein FKN15_004478 [Acipenser sinensis]
MIASFVGENHKQWDEWLPEFRFAINSARQETTGLSPAEVAVGRTLKGPLDRLIAVAPSPGSQQYSLLERQHNLLREVRHRVSLAQKRQAKNYNLRRRDVQLEEGTLVWVRTHPLSDALANFSAKLAPKWSGPAKIIKKLGPVNYQVQWTDQKQRVDTVHVVNLKPYFGAKPLVPPVGGGDYVAVATHSVAGNASPAIHNSE